MNPSKRYFALFVGLFASMAGLMSCGDSKLASAQAMCSNAMSLQADPTNKALAAVYSNRNAEVKYDLEGSVKACTNVMQEQSQKCHSAFEGFIKTLVASEDADGSEDPKVLERRNAEALKLAQSDCDGNPNLLLADSVMVSILSFEGDGDARTLVNEESMTYIQLKKKAGASARKAKE